MLHTCHLELHQYVTELGKAWLVPQFWLECSTPVQPASQRHLHRQLQRRTYAIAFNSLALADIWIESENY
jgi:hypothetical protein